jgi:hypothetical protein
MLKRWFVVALPAVLILGLGWHFSMTLIHVMPTNPISIRLAPIANRYIAPLFVQRWELFAPDPHLDTRMLLVACRVPVSGGETRETPWTNVTAALRAMKNRYRFSPADRLEDAAHGGLAMMFHANDSLVTKLAARKDERFEPIIQRAEELQELRVKNGLRLVIRVASAECDRQLGADVASEVGLRMVIRELPVFSKRHEPDSTGKTSYIEFGWWPHEPSVAAI